MSQFVVRIGEDEYVLWSTVVDASVTYACTAKELEEIYVKDAVQKARAEIRRGVMLADAHGHSNAVYRGQSVREVLAHNTHGEGETALPYDELLEFLRKPPDTVR